MLLWPEKSSASFYWPLAAAAAPPIMPATSRRLAACSSRGLLAVTLALLSGAFQLAVAFRVDFLLTPRQHVLRRDVADGTCSGGRCCNARRKPAPGAAHRPARAVFRAGYTRSSATCANARFSHSIGDSRGKFGHAS